MSLTQEVRKWGNLTRQELIFKLQSLKLKDKQRATGDAPLIDTLKFSMKTRGGDLHMVAFSFAIKGLFLELGTGRHRPKGSDAAKRASRPWLRPVIEGGAIDSLADILAAAAADEAIDNLKINIPGVISTIVKKS